MGATGGWWVWWLSLFSCGFVVWLLLWFSFMRLRFCVFDFVTFCVLDWWFSVAGV